MESEAETDNRPDAREVVLVEALASDAPVFGRLMQLYVHDLSDLVPMDIEDDGRFAFSPEQRYWSEPRFHPWLVRAGGRLAGFVVVDDVSRLTGEPVSDMSQFFILKKFRRTGVGARAARLTFDRRPGPWEVRQASANLPAIAFWRRVIAEYTGGVYTDDVTVRPSTPAGALPICDPGSRRTAWRIQRARRSGGRSWWRLREGRPRRLPRGTG